eukprot:ANDGO_02914.mRNA.1 hypothetical protein
MSIARNLLSCISSLDAHHAVLSAEMHQIKEDVARLERLSEKYRLRKTKKANRMLGALLDEKEQLKREIEIQIDLFSLHLDSGVKIAKRLDVSCGAAVLSGGVIDAESSILAHQSL